MRNLLLFMLAALLSVPGFAQLNCNNVNAAFSLSASGGLVTLTNSSTPTATSTILTSYTINWGDNSPVTYAGNNSNKTHTYNTSGTYTVTMYSMVTDSINNVTCYDTAANNITVTTSLNCNNVNAAGYVWSNGTTWATLVNNSTPFAGPNLAVNYTIHWGDGSNPTNTTSRSNQLHNYSSGGNYWVTLIVTVHDSNNNITCVDSLIDSVAINGNGILNCNTVNAAFNKSVNGTTATIFNNSTPNPGSGITASYKFYWGDGSSTTKTNKTNTSHIYAANGSYTVKLVATYTAGNTTCVDSMSDSVNINVTPPNVISGLVIVDSTSNLDSYKVWLITFDSSTNILSAVDSQTIATMAGSGSYYFGGKAAGSYRTKAALYNGPTSGTGHVPTYHDSALLWSNAQVINHTGGSSTGKHIYMRTGTLTSGPGFVGGNVSQGANKGTANGIPGMTIFLLDNNNNPVTYAVTDANGDYSFSNLPVGSYKVHPEDMNYATTAASFNITQSQTAHIDINFERSNSQKTIVPIASGISNINNNELVFSAYPNPATDVININWSKLTDEVATVTITDISGKKVFSAEMKMDTNAAINISTIQSGFYFLNIATESGSNTQKLMIQ